MKYTVLKVCLTIFCVTMLSSQVNATPTQDLKTCLIDSLNGKERKQLAVSMFLAMSVHPGLKAYPVAADESKERVDKAIGKVITRLFVENCANEAKAARTVDPLAIKKAFELVAKLAIQELVSNPEVKKEIVNYAKYLDQDKFKALFAK